MPQQHVFFGRPQPQPQPRSLRLRTGVVAPTSSGAGGPSTPVPSWKLYENPFYDGLAAAVAAAAEAAAAAAAAVEQEEEEEQEDIQAEQEGARERDAEAAVGMAGSSEALGGSARPPFVSARKLAASLWEELQQEVPAARPSPLCDPPDSSPRSHLQSRPSSLSNSDSPHSANQQPSKVSKVSTRSPQSTRSLQRPPSISPPLKTIMLMRPKLGAGDIARLRNSASKSASSSQVSPLGRDTVEQLADLTDKYHLTDAGLITSPRDYIKAMNRSQALEEKQMESSPIVSALSEELKRALTRVQELEVAQSSARKEVDSLLRRCADEITMLRTREQEKIQAAVLSIAEELDKERRARRKLETENRKLSRSLAEASKVAIKVEKELDKERKARQLMEDVCDELAREIGEDKAEVEELKREHAKARDEIDEERKTLQMTEAWREERVQMKLSEARLELEERCMALDKLKMELDMYLNSGITQAFLEHRGSALREAVEKLQEETSGSMLLLEDTSCYLPDSRDDAVSSDDIPSVGLARDIIRGQSYTVIHSDVHARDEAQWVMHSTGHAREDSGGVMGSDRHNREESDRVKSNTNIHFNVHDRPWTNHKPPSRSRRNEAAMKSHGSRTKGLSSLGDRDPGEDSYRDGDHRDKAESDDVGSQWEYAGERRYNNQEEESNWSADCDDSNGDGRQGDNATRSASEVEEENGSRSSPEFRRMYRLSERMNEVGHSATRVKKNHGGQGAGRFGHHHDANATSMTVARDHPKFPHTRPNVLHAEDDCELFSVAGPSPVYKHHVASPDFMTQKGSWPIIDPSNRSASQGRRASVESSVEWPKPLRSNSLQAKLLLEDRMNGLDLQIRHSKEVRSKR